MMINLLVLVSGVQPIRAAALPLFRALTHAALPNHPPHHPRQGIEDHFLEQWHQKLHTNTTPEDVTICEAYLAFLRSGTMDEFWWGPLGAGMWLVEPDSAVLGTGGGAGGLHVEGMGKEFNSVLTSSAVSHLRRAPALGTCSLTMPALPLPLCRRVAWERGQLTPERLASMDHPITGERWALRFALKRVRLVQPMPERWLQAGRKAEKSYSPHA